MSIFDAANKAGYAVGVQLVVTDNDGVKVSSTPSEWYGFDRNLANTMATNILDAVEGVILSYREQLEGKSGAGSPVGKRQGR